MGRRSLLIIGLLCLSSSTRGDGSGPCRANNKEALTCHDGTEMPITTDDDWPSCADNGGRDKCPSHWPWMCFAKTNNQDFWCKRTADDCCELGGLRECPSSTTCDDEVSKCQDVSKGTPNRPALLPASVPDPLAYYFLDEGKGFALKDFVSGDIAAGRIIYNECHQTVAYTEPNWVDDDFFGTAIQCGKSDTKQKDTLQLADVNYGHSGKWSISLWFRHNAENFEDYEREQLIGHGDGREPTSSANQFHVQLEKLFHIRTIVHGKFTNTPVILEAFDTNWHQYVFTANPDNAVGEYFVYIDGSQKDSGVVQTASFDPVGAFRLCGRLKSTGWDAERYFLGKVAHFAVWDSAMTPEQVQALYSAYLVASSTTTRTTTGEPDDIYETTASGAILPSAGFLPAGIVLAASAATFLKATT